MVWLENVTKHDVNKQIMDWYVDVTDLQGIKVAGQNVDQVAWSIVTEFRLIKGMAPQPPSPTYQQPVYQPVSQPAPQAQPVRSPPPAPRLNVQVGEEVQFGQYPQGANGEVQPLEWRVLAVENGRALLITDRLINAIPYNKEYADVTWETCTLRKWMNNDFISKTFSSSQQAQIATVTNQNPNNPEYGTKGGNATQDRIFALSIDEAKKYFRDDDDRLAAPTGYAKKQGSSVSKVCSLSTGEKTGRWWLRSPGGFSNFAVEVEYIGSIEQLGSCVHFDDGCVRPAFWLNL